MTRIFTIGHSTLDVLDFIELLRKHGVRMIIDVRSDPYSRYAPQFNKADIERVAENSGIGYRYRGAQLGGKPKDQGLYTAGEPDYDKLAETPEFRSEIEQLISSARETTVVLMCSEGDPMACHRERLLARVLRARGVEVLHILPDGAVYQPPQRSLL